MPAGFLIQGDRFSVEAGMLKALPAKGKPGEMWIEGIASTKDEDEDGEAIDIRGLDFSYCKAYGKYTWEHRTKEDPVEILGAPKKVELRPPATPREVYTAGILYKGNPKSERIYRMMVENPGEQIWGFSLEGKIVERDPDDPNHIRKAEVRNIAITSNPVNTKTFVDFVKALQAGTVTDATQIAGGQAMTVQSIDTGLKTVTWDERFLQGFDALVQALLKQQKFGKQLKKTDAIAFLVGKGLTKDEATHIWNYLKERKLLKGFACVELVYDEVIMVLNRR